MIFAMLLGMAVFAVPAMAQVQADPREELETAIPEAIRLLEAREYETFLKTFTAPDDFKKITGEVSMEEFAAKFEKDKVSILLRILQAVKDKEPAFDAEKKKATFKHGIQDVSNSAIDFVKVGDYWYIKN